MTVIVSGKIYVRAGCRAEFLKKSTESVKIARSAKGCIDFVVAADPIEANRVNVYEEWFSESELRAFRGSGPDADISALVESARVNERCLD